MTKTKKESCYDPKACECCCSVESVISVDERGQMVLPKEVREKACINPGDKLTVVCWKNDNKVSCISLIKAEDLGKMVKDMMGPIMGKK